MSVVKAGCSVGLQISKRSLVLCLGVVLSTAVATRASAQLAVSQLIVELKPGASRIADIEIFNESNERSFVSVEPREIISAGLDKERSQLFPDPEALGLLVSPVRLVIEPRQRKRLRIAAIGPAPSRERVYRVTVKPVSGDVASTETGLKLLVGYDLLVLVRPLVSAPNVELRRTRNVLTILNRGNTSVELAEGKQCDETGKTCQQLPSKRLYAGASWQQSLPEAKSGEYRIRAGRDWSTARF